MTGSEENCNTCGKSKKTGTGTGFVTRFIDICQCDFVSENEREPTLVCAVCNLKIKGEKKGSMTQWIFQAGFCSCDKPQPHCTEEKRFSQPEFVGYKQLASEKYLELEPDSFPIERYKPIKELGRGASGSVYLARDLLLQTQVAVKLLHNLRDDLLVSFQAEAKSTSKLDHPTIIKVLDFGSNQSGMTPVMVLEYFDGVSLERYLNENGAIEQRKACLLFSTIADGLAYAHSKGVFHRDIKPSNILVSNLSDDEPDVKIIDFGIAKVKQSTSQPIEYQNKSIAGTPGFMSPDQITGFDYDERSEVYSLACVLFKALCGKAPFEADGPLEILALQTNSEPPDIGSIDHSTIYSDNLKVLLKNCLSIDPEERIQSMPDLSRELKSISQEHIKEFESEAPSETRKHKSGILITAFSLIAVCSMAAYWLVSSDLFRSEESLHQNNANKKSAKIPHLLDLTDDSNPFLSSKSRLISFPGPSGYETYILEDSKNRLPDLSKLDDKKAKVMLLLKFTFMDVDALNKVLAVKPLRGIGLSINSGINDDTIKPVLKRTDLEILQIVDGGKLTENAYASLQALPNLKQLDLQNCDIDSTKVRQIAKLKSLDVLDIKYDKKLDQRSMEYILTRLKNITHLNLVGTPVTDNYLTSFTESRCPKDLGLAFTRITDNGINILVRNKCPVVHLDLSGTQITRKGFLQLQKLPDFKYLTLRESPRINKHEIEFLKNSVKFEILDILTASKLLE